MMTHAATASSSSFTAFGMGRFNTGVARGAGALHLLRVGAAAGALHFFDAGALPMMVTLAFLVDGAVGAVGGLLAALPRGGVRLEMLRRVWQLVGMGSLVHLLTRVTLVGALFPQDVAAVTTGSTGAAFALVWLLAAAAHVLAVGTRR